MKTKRLIKSPAPKPRVKSAAKVAKRVYYEPRRFYFRSGAGAWVATEIATGACRGQYCLDYRSARLECEALNKQRQRIAARLKGV